MTYEVHGTSVKKNGQQPRKVSLLDEGILFMAAWLLFMAAWIVLVVSLYVATRVYT